MATTEAVPVFPSMGVSAFPPDENFTSKALHLRLKFEKLGNSRKVQTSQIDVGEADETLVRVSKKLLDCPELKAIGSADADLKSRINNICLPFPEKGMRLVPKKAVERVNTWLREYTTRRRLMIDAFMLVYETEKDRAQTRLKHLYNAKDYPSAELVREQFAFSFEWVTFGPPGELQEIDPDIFRQEREKATKTLESAVEMGQTMLLQTFTEMIERLKTSLTPTEDGKKRKLYDNAVTNLQEFIENFSFRNVSNYRELQAQVERAKRAVGSINADKIRESDTLRTVLNTEMKEIEKSLQDLTAVRTRKFKFNEGVQ